MSVQQVPCAKLSLLIPLAAIFLGTCAGISPGIALAAVDSTGKNSSGGGAYGPFCGLYCVYAAAKLNHRSFEFRNLLSPKYLDSSDGSTMAELAAAAEDNGLYVAALTDIGADELRQCKLPTILRVNFDPDSADYNHYYLLLGSDRGKARVLDPPGTIREFTWPALAVRCDGNALIVSSSPVDTTGITSLVRWKFAKFAAALLGAMLVLKLAHPHVNSFLTSTPPPLGTFLATLLLLVLSAAAGTTYHALSPVGFLAGAQTTEEIRNAHSTDFVSTIGLSKAEDLIAGGQAVFVDARMETDYQVGHLPGAISVPVDLPDDERQRRFTTVPKGSALVIYCQSSGCPYSRALTKKLLQDGFYNLRLYPGGWVDWDSAHRNSPTFKTGN
jgi:rhodanese-related sulfurtransferase